MELRAFNLAVGCVLNDPDLPCDVVVTAILRDSDNEVVQIAWMGHGEDVPDSYQGVTFPERYDYCDKVEIIGICVNPNDWTDVDYGTN